MEIRLLSATGRVLLGILENTDVSLADLASQLHVSEARISKVITDLVEAGLIERTRTWKKNHYRVKPGFESSELVRLIQILSVKEHEQ